MLLYSVLCCCQNVDITNFSTSCCTVYCVVVRTSTSPTSQPVVVQCSVLLSERWHHQLLNQLLYSVLCCCQNVDITNFSTSCCTVYCVVVRTLTSPTSRPVVVQCIVLLSERWHHQLLDQLLYNVLCCCQNVDITNFSTSCCTVYCVVVRTLTSPTSQPVVVQCIVLLSERWHHQLLDQLLYNVLCCCQNVDITNFSTSCCTVYCVVVRTMTSPTSQPVVVQCILLLSERWHHQLLNQLFYSVLCCCQNVDITNFSTSCCTVYCVVVRTLTSPTSQPVVLQCIVLLSERWHHQLLN